MAIFSLSRHIYIYIAKLRKNIWKILFDDFNEIRDIGPNYFIFNTSRNQWLSIEKINPIDNISLHTYEIFSSSENEKNQRTVWTIML